MIHSFRLRLAILLALLGGLTLAGFSLGTWWLIREIRIERIDYEVRSNAEREVDKSRNNIEWQRIESRLVSDIGVRKRDDLLLLVQNSKGETVYRSPHWPSKLITEQFPWPSKQAGSVSRRQDSFLSPYPDTENHPPEMPNIPSSKEPNFEEVNPPPPPSSSNGKSSPNSISVSQRTETQQWYIGLAKTDQARVAVAVESQVIDVDMQGIRNAILVAIPLTLLLIGVGGWIFSGRALAPINKLTATARSVTAEGLDQRIPIQGEDHEFVELIGVFNHMLERLERSFKQAHRFSADAAHELKTPLAILQGQLERAIAKVEAGSAIQSDLIGILDEVRRLSTISRKLLLLSQADAGRLKIHREPFDLSNALSDLVEDSRMLAPKLQINSSIQPNLIVSADESLLRQVFHNLISNAIKYNFENGWIDISTKMSQTNIEIVFANSSTGIQIADQGKLFERFFRADPAHHRQIEGVGLGLSLSREIARAHGGDISFEGDHKGAVKFSLLLPITEIL